jgi:putative transposase
MGLFRYQLIQEGTGRDLSSRERGVLIRELAGRVHEGPGGHQITVSPQTSAGGSVTGGPEGSRPAKVRPRTPAEVLALAVALKKENPDRTAAQVTRILAAHTEEVTTPSRSQSRILRNGIQLRKFEGSVGSW